MWCSDRSKLSVIILKEKNLLRHNGCILWVAIVRARHWKKLYIVHSSRKNYTKSIGELYVSKTVLESAIFALNVWLEIPDGLVRLYAWMDLRPCPDRLSSWGFVPVANFDEVTWPWRAYPCTVHVRFQSLLPSIIYAHTSPLSIGLSANKSSYCNTESKICWAPSMIKLLFSMFKRIASFYHLSLKASPHMADTFCTKRFWYLLVEVVHFLTKHIFSEFIVSIFPLNWLNMLYYRPTQIMYN